MYSDEDTLAGGLPHSDIHGSTPARGSPWLFAACHVLHRLLVPRHPPNALLILDIPDAPEEDTLTMHRNHPQRTLRTVSEICVSAHIDIPKWPFFPNCSRNKVKHPSGNIVHNASEPSSPTVGAPLSRATIPGQTSRSNDGISTSPTD